MGIEAIGNAIPDYAKDLCLNLGSIITTSSLDPAIAWGSALAAALGSKNQQVIQGILEDARAHLDETLLNGVMSATAIMSMNNV